MKLTIIRLVRKDTDKEGKPLITKDGRPYIRLALQAKEFGSKWISFFGAPWNQTWAEGQVVEADVVEKGGFLNGSRVDPLGLLSKAIFDANVRIGKLEARIEILEKSDATPPPPKPTPAEFLEPPDDDTELPF